MTTPPWLNRVRSEHPGFDGRSMALRRFWVTDDGRKHPHDGSLTCEEMDLRAALAQENAELRELHAYWWTAGAPPGPPDPWNELQAQRQKAADEADDRGAAGAVPILRIYCRQCGADNKQRRDKSGLVPIARVWGTSHGLYFEAAHEYFELARTLRARGERPRVANKAFTETRVLLQRGDPATPLVSCRRHGTAYLTQDEIVGAVTNGSKWLVVACSKSLLTSGAQGTEPC